MKNFFSGRKPSFDSQSVNATIQRAFASAGLDTSSGLMRGVSETIRRALAPGGSAAPAPASTQPVVDVVAHVVDVGVDGDVDVDSGAHRAPDDRPVPGRDPAPGTFETHTIGNGAGRWSYKVYVPAQAAAARRPIVVMLHGCTQSAEDFAAGTRMNELADEHGLLVVYPEQATHANATKCWNWFNPQDQQRDAGEPALIAAIVHEVARRHDADLRRVFVAGLSAGAAMAVVLGETYPELFAGIGVHSGLAYGSARDIPSALAAMKGGRSGLPGLQGLAVGDAASRTRAAQAVPVIVFHGDRDHTVQHDNAAEIVRQARAAHSATAGAAGLQRSTQTGTAAGGRRYTRTIDADASGRAPIESWTLHGAGHAWSGGDARGSYTDAAGPDASAEMVRFFLALPRAGSA